MRISGKLLATVSAIFVVISLVVPARARGDTIGVVDEGQQLTINGFTFTNPNAFAIELNAVTIAVTGPHFAGDPSDFVTGVNFAGGTCLPLIGVPGGFAGNSTCTVNLTFSTPPADVGEPIDFGVSQISIGGFSTPGGVTEPFTLFEIQVNDAPVPEPGSLSLLGLGSSILICLSYASVKHERGTRSFVH